MTEQTAEIKIIRLNTGEDIIGTCLFDDDNDVFLIECPMKVIISRVTDFGKTMLIMMPWLPLEIIEDNFASIDLNDVITIINPKKDFIEYYYSTVEKYDLLMEKTKQEGSSFFEDELDEDEELDDDALEEMLQVIKDRKDKSIH